jgi:phospholipase C
MAAMKFPRLHAALAALVISAGGLGACGSSTAAIDASGPIDAPVTIDAPALTEPDAMLHSRDASANVPTARTNIQHVILIVQENHTFDSYFGPYCTSPFGTEPTCTTGPACCETNPTTEPGGASPHVLDDLENSAFDPTHAKDCEVLEMDNGAMDHFVSGTACAAPENFAIAPPSLLHTYHGYATNGALADRYFQSAAGQSAENDQYFAVGKFVFLDNDFEPDAIGHACASNHPTTHYSGQTTIYDLMRAGGFNVVSYAEGWGAAVASAPGCAPAPDDCPLHVPIYPCEMDPDDVPWQYYDQFVDKPDVMADIPDLLHDLQAGSLPTFAFVKPIGYHSEHPGVGNRISDGEAWVDGIVQAIQASPYKDNTLILLTWDESGGYFDHVKPPADSTVDQQPYGPRIPFLALGKFAAKNKISHVQMEHASIVRFLEWNFLMSTGQLGTRDAVVNNIGSMLDPSTTGVTVPEN